MTESGDPSPTVLHVTWDSCKADWRLTEEGRRPTLARFEEKQDAVERARALAEGASGGRVIVHREDGSLERELVCGEQAAKGGPEAPFDSPGSSHSA